MTFMSKPKITKMVYACGCPLLFFGCFLIMDAVRTANLCDVYTNDRYRRSCFRTVCMYSTYPSSVYTDFIVFFQKKSEMLLLLVISLKHLLVTVILLAFRFYTCMVNVLQICSVKS